MHQKNHFTKISKNLDTDLKVILLDDQNNWVEHTLNVGDNVAKSLNIVANQFKCPT